MRVVVFVDYSDPLGGLLSWISDSFQYATGIELLLAGVVTEPRRVPWAKHVDVDLPPALHHVHPDDVKAVLGAASLGELPESLRSLISAAPVLIPNAYETGFQLGALARRLGERASIVTFCHTDEPHYYYLAERYEVLTSKFLSADTKCYEGLKSRIPHRHVDIQMTPHGFRVSPVRDRSMRSELRLLYVGRVVNAQKRVFDLIELARTLRAYGVPFRLSVIGDGDDRSKFEYAAAHFPEISCLGALRREEVLRRYEDYDFFILASEYEGMSIALLEAMSQGLIPVVTAVGGAPDLIDDGREGYLWPVGEVSIAAQRLAKLWRDSGLRSQISRAARARIEREHEPRSCRARLIQVLHNAAAVPAGSMEDARGILESGTRSPYFADG
jgi:glycosyltransferase involved in cell wall biosynthesis